MSPRSPEERRAVRQAMSVAVATGLYGVSFGALSVAAGLDVLQTMALSLLMFSGGSQFAFIGVVGVGRRAAPPRSPPPALLGARNGLYGVQVAPLLDARGWRRAAGRTADDRRVDRGRHSPSAPPPRSVPGSGGPASGSSRCGTRSRSPERSLGDALGDPTRYGLDAAAAAAFLALLWPRLAGRLAQLAAAGALLVALALTPLVAAGIPVLAAAVVAVVVGWTSPGHRRSGQRPPPGRRPR